MSERDTTYDDVTAAASKRFELAVSDALRKVDANGGRLLSRSTLDACLRASVKATVDETGDVALLAVVSTRPWLLHVEPKLYGSLPSPRGSLDHALEASVRKDLSEMVAVRMLDGQDSSTLPESAEAALAALAEIEASGRRFRDSVDARRVLSAGDWDDDLVYGVGMPLCEFLVAQGRIGLGNDLMAAIEAREAVMEGGTAPSLR